MRLTTASAVIPLTALATANWVSTVFGACNPRCAQAVRPRELQLVAAIDARDAGELRLSGDPIDLVRQCLHQRATRSSD